MYFQTTDNQAVIDHTREVMGRPSFHHQEREMGWLERLGEWFDSLFEFSESNAAESITLTQVALYVIVIAAVAALVYLVFTLVRGMRGSQAQGISVRRSAMVALKHEADSWEDAVAQVRAALAENNHHRAVWILHRLLLGALNESGALHFKRWKTNRLYLAEVKASHKDLLHRLTTVYDAVIYAHHAADGEQLAGFLQEVETLRRVSV